MSGTTSNSTKNTGGGFSVNNGLIAGIWAGGEGGSELRAIKVNEDGSLVVSGGGSNPRDSAVRVDQTINVAGSITAVTYLLANGDTITDTLLYGPNSTTEPTTVIFGAISANTLVLSNFIIAANGTSVTYTATGGTVTNLVGSFTVGASAYNLVHVSSGVATIQQVYQGQVATVTTSTNTVPKFRNNTGLTNAPVTNNSTVVLPTLVLSNFAIGTNGTSGTYSSSGGTVTLLTGDLRADGSPVPITHVSAGVFTIASPVRQGAVLSLTATANPTLATPVSNVTVTNNSTYNPQVTLSSFVLGTNGTSVTYNATGGTVGALSGNLIVGGTSYPLTHISSGAASIPTAILTGAVVTVTINSSTPTLGSIVSGAAVTNNSTVVPNNLSAFVVGTNGTSVSYTTSGQPITALTGSLTFNGVVYPLTHVSNGNATVATGVPQGQTGTVTITASTPILSTAITGVAVTNNSTFVPPPALTKQSLTWTGTGVTQSGDTVTNIGDNSWGLANVSFPASSPFEVIGAINLGAPGALLVVIDDDAAAINWGGGTSLWKAGVMHYTNGNEYWASGNNGSGTGFGAIGAAKSNPLQYKISSTGNGTVDVATRANGGSYVSIKTFTGITGTLRLKTLTTANPSNSISATVALYV